MKYIAMILNGLLLIGCQSNQGNAAHSIADTTLIADKDVPQKEMESNACAWLKIQVESYFNQEESSIMESMTTKEYYEYKMDAMNVDLGLTGSLSLTEFNKKWSPFFNVQFAGIGSGFLISGQDWKEIKLSTCDIVKETDTEIILKVLISDCGLSIDYHREISLVKVDGEFKISDVKEYD
ncbi:hypothetical protein ACFRAE_04495 [Sphingobacterium sp. HJSM2_6]|uniref:hypothetical protein n=1 Tax=Sphingobacterium sp. HJSM2_6 TaxID=3366264 RepID=UPI003BC45E22